MLVLASKSRFYALIEEQNQVSVYKTWDLIVARTCMSHGWSINYCQSDADANVSLNTGNERWRVCNWIWFNSLCEGNDKMGLVLCRSQPSAGEFNWSSHNERLKQRDSQTGNNVFFLFFLRLLFIPFALGERSLVVTENFGVFLSCQRFNISAQTIGLYRIIHTQHLIGRKQARGGGWLPGPSCLEILKILICLISPFLPIVRFLKIFMLPPMFALLNTLDKRVKWSLLWNSATVGKKLVQTGLKMDPCIPSLTPLTPD